MYIDLCMFISFNFGIYIVKWAKEAYWVRQEVLSELVWLFESMSLLELRHVLLLTISGFVVCSEESFFFFLFAGDLITTLNNLGGVTATFREQPIYEDISLLLIIGFWSTQKSKLVQPLATAMSKALLDPVERLTPPQSDKIFVFIK
ncbi:hypothetical protein ACJX0J_021755 [Zea mays]